MTKQDSLQKVLIKKMMGASLVVQWLRIHLPKQGMRVQSLVGELRSHVPQGNLAPSTVTTEPVHPGAYAPQLRPNAAK